MGLHVAQAAAIRWTFTTDPLYRVKNRLSRTFAQIAGKRWIGQTQEATA